MEQAQLPGLVAAVVQAHQQAVGGLGDGQQTVLGEPDADGEAVGHVEALDGFPFDGLELRKVAKEPAWEIVAHRGYQTLCSGSVDLPAVYAYAGGQYTEQNARSAEYLKSTLEQDLARWSRQKSRSMQLLQTLAAEYAMVGQRDEGERFFNLNLPPFLPELEKSGVDSGACQEDVASLLDRLAGRSG